MKHIDSNYWCYGLNVKYVSKSYKFEHVVLNCWYGLGWLWSLLKVESNWRK